MLVNIQSFILNTGINTQAMQFFDAEEQDETADGSPEVDDQYAEHLCSEESPAVSVEGTRRR